MYKHFFGLRENPFNVNPDPRYLFLTRQTEEALEELTYGIQARKGLFLLTGEVGTGKTTLINHLLDRLHQQQAPTAFIFNTHLETRHLFDFMLADFGVPFDSRAGGGALMCLNQWLLGCYRADAHPVLIVDEAQGLSFELFEEIRLLLNLETPHEKLLQVVLVGQPELDQRLKRYELRQLRQRIAFHCHTAPLTPDETRGYIHARLQIAGSNGKPVFTPDAIDAVYAISGGVPRVMNLICEASLVSAYVDEIRPITVQIVEAAAREFQIGEVCTSAPLANHQDLAGVARMPVHSTVAKAPNHSPPATDTVLALSSERISTSVGESHVIAFPNAPVYPPALTEPGRGEAVQLSDSTGLTSETAFKLLAELAPRLPAAVSSPLLQLFAAGDEFIFPAPSKRRAALPSESPWPRVIINGSSAPLSRSFARAQTIYSPNWLNHWSAWCRVRWLLIVDLLSEVEMAPTLHKWLRRRFGQAKTLVPLIYQRWPATWDIPASIAQSISRSRMVASSSRWLKQPFRQTKRRQPNSMPSQVRTKFSLKRV